MAENHPRLVIWRNPNMTKIMKILEFLGAFDARSVLGIIVFIFDEQELMVIDETSKI